MSTNEKKEGPDAPAPVVTTTSAPERSNKIDNSMRILSPESTDAQKTGDNIVGLKMGKPGPSQFFRVHPTLYAEANLLKAQVAMDEVFYLAASDTAPHLNNVGRYILFLCVDHKQMPFLWPLSATSSDGYSESARQIAIAARDCWCRLVSDRLDGQFRMRVAPWCSDEPVWPQYVTLVDFLRVSSSPSTVLSCFEEVVS